MLIMGIDPGIATLGYGIVDSDKKLQVIDYGVIVTPKTESLPVRLHMLADSLGALISKHKPDAIAVEELFFAKNVKTAIQVAHARGVVLYCAVKECGKLYEYTPLQVKQALTGYGRAEKSQIQYMVKTILGLGKIPKPDDAADALAIAITHSQTKNLADKFFI